VLAYGRRDAVNLGAIASYLNLGMLTPAPPAVGRLVVLPRGVFASARERATTEQRHGRDLYGHDRLCAAGGDSNDDRCDKVRDQREPHD